MSSSTPLVSRLRAKRLASLTRVLVGVIPAQVGMPVCRFTVLRTHMP